MFASRLSAQFKLLLSLMIISFIVACNVIVSIGPEDPEVAETEVEVSALNDPLNAASTPIHPMRRFQSDRMNTDLRKPFAAKALLAREAISFLATGNYYSCGRNSESKVKCWGYSGSGGDGRDPTQKDTFNYFSAYNGTARKIAIGIGTTCIMTDDSSVYCHGTDLGDQLGNGSSQDSFKPVVPTGLESGIVDLDARSYKFCSVLKNGSLKCWGNGFATLPTEIVGRQRNFLLVTVGVNHHCVIDSDFRALCWGQNTKGQLGLDIEKVSSKSAPVYVENLAQGVVQLAVGSEHTCALLSSGSVKCWGLNANGELGNGNTADSSVPVQVSGLESNVVSINAGDAHTCALKEDGSVFCWGENEKGQLGNGNNENQTIPQQVLSLSVPVTHMSAGPEYTCVLNADQAAMCWGHGSSFGLLGDGKNEDSNVPVHVRYFTPNEQ